MNMDVLDNLLPNPVLDADPRTAELQSQVLMLTKLESLFVYWQEES